MAGGQAHRSSSLVSGSEVLDMSTALYEKLTLLLRAFADSDEDGHAAVA